MSEGQRERREKKWKNEGLGNQRKEEEELAKKRAEDKAARDYALLDVVDHDDEDAISEQPKTVQEMMDDFM